MKRPMGFDLSIRSDPSIASSLKITKQRASVIYRMKLSIVFLVRKAFTVSLMNWKSEVCIMSSSL